VTATLGRLLAAGAVPVINENDSVATQEIRFGDNDRLAARVGQAAAAQGCCCCPTSTGFMIAIRVCPARCAFPWSRGDP
jgi:hypothetical protein